MWRHRSVANHPSTTTRIPWVEAVRWVAAVAVVIQHSLFPLTLESIAAGQVSAAWLVNAALRFPVPVFFFLSGFVAEVGFERGKAPRYASRVMRTALPYITYSLFYSFLAFISGRTSDLPPGHLFLRVVLADDAGHLWFLASLTVVAPLGVFFWRRWGDAFAYTAGVSALAFGSLYSYSMVWKSLGSTTVRMFIVPLGLYAAGLWWARRRRRVALGEHRKLVAFIGAACLVLSIVEMYVAELVMEPHWHLGQQWYASLTLASVLICVSCDLFAEELARLRGVRLLAALPAVTLGVYCLHQALLDHLIPLPQMMQSSAWTAVLAGVLASVLSALIVSVLSRSKSLRPFVM